MKSELKKIKGTTVNVGSQKYSLTDYFSEDDTEFDQIYYTINDENCVAKVYSLSSSTSLSKFKNEAERVKSGLGEILPQCLCAQEFKIRKKSYGLIVLKGVFKGNSLTETNLKVTELELMKLALSMVKLIKQVKTNKLIFCNLRPQHIFKNQQGYTPINLEFLQNEGKRTDFPYFLFEAIEKDYRYTSPEFLDSYKQQKLDYTSDLFSLGCILYEVKYGKYPFESKYATLNLSYDRRDDETYLGNVINKFLSQSKVRKLLNLDRIIDELEKLVQELTENEKEVISLMKRKLNSQSTTENSLDRVKGECERNFLSFVQDNEKAPNQKYLQNILFKVYEDEQKLRQLVDYIETYTNTFETNKNICLKSLLLVGELLRRGPSDLFDLVKDLLTKMSEDNISQEVKNYGSILLQKIRINGKVKKYLNGNFYLTDLTDFKFIQIQNLKDLTKYLKKVIEFFKQKTTEKVTDVVNSIIFFTSDEIYNLISMLILFIISIRYDNKISLRSDQLQELKAIQKQLTIQIRKISNLSNFVPSHPLYCLQTEYIAYQEEICLRHKPTQTSLEHFYQFCRYYKGLSIPENYTKTYKKEAKEEKTYVNYVHEKNFFELSDDEDDFDVEVKKEHPSNGGSENLFDYFGYDSKKEKNKKENSESGKKSITKRKSITFEDFGNLTSDKKCKQKAKKEKSSFDVFKDFNIKEENSSKPSFEDFNVIQNNKKIVHSQTQKLLNFDEIKKQISKPPSFDTSNPFSKNIAQQKINEKYEKIKKELKLKELKALLEENKELLIDFEELKFEKEIGSGGAGQVYLGTYKNEKIAIKRVKTKENKNALKEFERELVTLIKMKNKKNLVNLVGLTQDKGEFYLLTEYCEYGSLFDILHRQVNEIALSWEEKAQFALQVSEGMKNLHQMNPIIIHRDLKSLNVFATKNNQQWKLKVADFGLSRSPEAEMMTTQLGTIHWMAPQLLQSKQYSTKVDVYSFGILLWEILARRTPYCDVKTSPMALLKYVAIDKKRPNLEMIGKDCPKELIRLMCKCWQHEPEERPNFEEIIQKLQTIISSLRK